MTMLLQSQSLETPAQLTGIWLRLARGLYLVAIVISLGWFLVNLPFAFQQVQMAGVSAQIGLPPTLYALYTIGLDLLFVALCTVVSLTIFWHKSGETITLLTAGTLVVWGIFNGLILQSSHALGTPEAMGGLLGLVGGALVFAGYMGWMLFFYLFPSGRFVPRWTRFTTLAWVLFSGSWILWPDSPLTPDQWPPWLFGPVVLSLWASFAVAQIYRYRRAPGPEQQQTKWVVYGVGVVVVGFLPSVMLLGTVFDVPLTDVGWHMLTQLLSIGFISLIPLTIGVAILRHRLWDIDFVINRSLVYAALTALLVTLFGGSLLLINSLFENFAGGPLVAVAISAAVFGAVFQPTRRRLQRFVDQRFYHIYIDYQKTPLPTLSSGGMTQVLRQTHFGAYKNLELIGRGGMAEVYKSTHPTLNIPVAIKVLPASLASEADLRQRFTREAQIVTNLEHANIVRVFDYGQQDDMQYMVMEYVGDQDLAAFLQANGKLSVASALPLMHQIADALDYAHAQGLVHRDIKPSNILLDMNSQTRVVLTDFGIAKMLDAHTAMTGTGSVLGTFHYIAPEQIETSPKVDGRADVYAFGVMVYQMLTGELPFKHSNPGALLIAHMTQPPPDPRQIAPDVPDNVAHAIQRAMAKNPLERFAMAGEFVAGLT